MFFFQIMDQDTLEIQSITFGIYSAEEIRKMSVCKLDSAKRSGPNTVYDPKMGSTDSSSICETCKANATKCTGHFGHIELNEPVIHPSYYRRVVSILSCLCMKCSRLMITKDQIYLDGLNKYKGEKRFQRLLEKIKKVDICCHEGCESEKPKIKFNPTDSTISMIYEDKINGKTSIILTVDEIKKVFENITDDDVGLMGINPELSHPKNFILTCLPVLPPCDRPYVKADGNLCDDDLTNQYIEIIKANNSLSKLEEQGTGKSKEIAETKKQKALASIRFRIATTFNNSQGKAKHTTNGRAVKGIKERLSGKDGQIRNNVMGKRCNYTGRTVIGPDPTLKLGQLAIPAEMANTLTVPIRVASYNKEYLQGLIDEGLVDTLFKPDGETCINLERYRLGTRLIHGDIIHRKGEKITVAGMNERVQKGDKVERNGEFLENLKPYNRKYIIDIGWIVERKIQDGDYVLLNRQPTLHKGSMMAMEAVIKDYKTLRMNLAICKSFNADFDGDEMNIHVPQSLESQTELKLLSAAQWNMISAQSSKPNMCIVQDSLLGAYRMTKGNQKITKAQFFNISEKLELKDPVLQRMNHIRNILKQKGKKVQCFNGKGVISLFLPSDLNYEKKNNADPNEPVVKIWRGVLYEGTLDKSVLGAAHNSLIQVINKEYGAEAAAYFIDCVQFATNNWLMINSFSVGLGDCLVTDETKQQEISDVIQKCYIEADSIKTTTTHPVIRELRVNAALSKAKDIGLRIAKESLSEDNNFLSTVISGSKGDYFNIAQITGLLGQQNLSGQRVGLSMNNGRRSLVHYPFENIDHQMEYESRGFIASSFIKGLNPREFYFHSMSGREGITDTAMGTATSGYMQRRIVKLTEDIKVEYDGTVRDVGGNVYQVAYGESGIDPTTTVKVNGEQEVCDISRLIGKLNMKCELKAKK